MVDAFFFYFAFGFTTLNGNLFKFEFIASLPLVCQQYPLHEEHRTQSLYVQNLYPLRKHGPLMKYFDSLGILCHPGIQNFRKYYSREIVFLVWLFVLVCFVGLFFFLLCLALLRFCFCFPLFLITILYG